MIRKLKKYWKTICLQHRQACNRPRIISSMKNSPRKHNGSTYIIFQIDFLLMNLREIPAVLRANVSDLLRSGLFDFILGIMST